MRAPFDVICNWRAFGNLINSTIYRLPSSSIALPVPGRDHRDSAVVYQSIWCVEHAQNRWICKVAWPRVESREREKKRAFILENIITIIAGRHTRNSMDQCTCDDDEMCALRCLLFFMVMTRIMWHPHIGMALHTSLCCSTAVAAKCATIEHHKRVKKKRNFLKSRPMIASTRRVRKFLLLHVVYIWKNANRIQWASLSVLLCSLHSRVLCDLYLAASRHDGPVPAAKHIENNKRGSTKWKIN